MLSMRQGGGSATQAWQAVNVVDRVPACAEISAWVNSCSADADPFFGLWIRTFNDDNGYPNHTLRVGEGLTLDRDPETWEKVLMCVEIPADTRWILAEVAFDIATMGESPGYVDDVELSFDTPDCCGATPIETKSWGEVKELFTDPVR